ncbi:hypothetical protein BGI41_01020 [Methanobrevibacter sp. 87.7]|uniref:hypothetical protein n=1 Tax=Methanobrevibacter sp. 87.7 TaxID=387957 RepID=UPI000B5137FE|nr:hypothetical protein [Methanobrevibacter sp. 87.7]OWT33707.1 hypothetical protein BGI41_01020 [Methanobrevibacter sp. 87.7]
MKFKKNKIIYTIIIIICIFLLINSVSAEDNNSTDINNNISSSDNSSSLTDFKDEIDNSQDTVYLNKDYQYTDKKDDNIDQINIDKNINGNGHKIDGKNKSINFYVSNNIILSNIQFVNFSPDYQLFRSSSGTNLSFINCSFYNNNVNWASIAEINNGNLFVNNSKFYLNKGDSQK